MVRFGFNYFGDLKMSMVTFDTLKFVDKLEQAGVSREQAKAEAEALVTALSEAMDSQLATKSDINRLERELMVVKWMVGAVLGLAVTSFAKQFV
jgi:hypothetical protein